MAGVDSPTGSGCGNQVISLDVALADYRLLCQVRCRRHGSPSPPHLGYWAEKLKMTCPGDIFELKYDMCYFNMSDSKFNYGQTLDTTNHEALTPSWNQTAWVCM